MIMMTMKKRFKKKPKKTKKSEIGNEIINFAETSSEVLRKDKTNTKDVLFSKPKTLADSDLQRAQIFRVTKMADLQKSQWIN